jgi:hypothetical protein
MAEAMEDGWNMATTAAVPKRARIVGRSIMLAQ